MKRKQIDEIAADLEITGKFHIGQHPTMLHTVYILCTSIINLGENGK
jgi:hypothetical protein